MYIYKNDKFNTIILKISFYQELKKEDATKRSLLPYVLNDGSKNYETQTLINKRLSYLYGASLSIGTTKKGNLSEISATVSFINPKIVKDETYTIKAVYDVLYDILFNPILKNDYLDKNIVEYEKEMLRQEILSQKENKQAYAVNEALNELYKDSLHSTKVIGYLEDLDKIDNINLTEYYQKCLSEDEIKVFITGDVIAEEFDFINIEKSINLKKNLFNKEPINEFLELNQTDDIKQAIFIMIYKTNIYQNSSLYEAAILLNYIFGASPSSLLFKVVREEHGLCYSISSSYVNSSGLFIINMGINQKDKEKCLELVNKQLLAIKNNAIEQNTLDEAKVSLKNRFLAQEDRQSYYLNQLINKEFFNIEFNKLEFETKLNNVSLDDLKAVSNQLELKLTYLLKGVDHEEV